MKNETETIVFNKLKELGFNPEFTRHNDSYDILCKNGNIRIEVKKGYLDRSGHNIIGKIDFFLSEGLSKKASKKKYMGITKKHNSSIHYKHGNRWYKDYTKSCDFIIGYYNGDFWIFSSFISFGLSKISMGQCIRKQSKYVDYKNNWDAIPLLVESG